MADIEDINQNENVEDIVKSDSEGPLFKKAKKKNEEEVVFGKCIITKNLDVVMHESMMPYSEHVILDRALPRVEDGLKPVQRRILYTLYDLGITPDKPYKKSARIVGDCLGKYHPHGDSSVYGAMVRMAQEFNMRATLVDGHGNFGSVDGDTAAAMRYTEARMTPLALELLRDLEKDTVQWNLNFDDSLKEPATLPCRFPNLLVNGASGIAVGLATNIPTHNLGEVISGVVAYIDNNKITLPEMMKHIKGPDFPTGGYITSGEDLIRAYATGKGKVIERAKVHIETLDNDKKNIVITELPYQVNKAVLLQRILELRETKKELLGGISDIRDESDRNGMRAVVCVKKDADISSILGTLFKYSDLQTSFNINMIAIAGGKPQLMGLLDIIGYYVNYQRDIIFRRTKFDYDAAKEREHILEGLVIAVKNIDEVIKIIKKSDSVGTAKTKLRERFTLSERQAQAILDMRLARLTSLEIFKLEQELAELKILIKKLSEILASKKLQLNIVKEEILEIKKKYKDDRRSKIISSIDEYPIDADPDSVPVENAVVGISVNGNIKRMTEKHVKTIVKQYTEKTSLFEIYSSLLKVSTDKTIIAFTSLGNAIKIDVASLPDCKWREKGITSIQICEGMVKNERILSIFELSETMPQKDLLFFTKSGMVKRTSWSEYSVFKRNYQAVKLKEDDEVISVCEFDKDKTMLFVTKLGMALNAEITDIPVQGRVSCGVKGINLNDGDEVIMATLIGKNGEVAVITDKSYGKRIKIAELDIMARYRKGYKVIDLKGNVGTCVIFASIIESGYEIVMEDNMGLLVCIYSSSLMQDNRLGKGKAIIKGNTILTKAYKYMIE
ncbi:MAG: DNA topoisomerase (ATP-hydrolyzing) [Clostridia bacterium]